jgi:hypothetical protein
MAAIIQQLIRLWNKSLIGTAFNTVKDDFVELMGQQQNDQ